MSNLQNNDRLINISIIGHVDSGKSTLCGMLASKWGGYDSRMQTKLQKEADEYSKSSFSFAYFTDRTEIERRKGITISTTLVTMSTEKKDINFIDCPGHADYIKNATTGCKQSDLSLAIVPADFQASVSEKGTLKIHLMLAAVLGAKNIIVCINKFDQKVEEEPQNCVSTFEAACASVGKELKKVGVAIESVMFLPISAYKGIGLFRGGPQFDFFKPIQLKEPKNGFTQITCLEDAIDCQDAQERHIGKPLRMPISSIARVQGAGIIYCGRVDYGSLKKDDPIKFLPTGITGVVKTVQAHKADVPIANAGMNIGFTFTPKDKAAPVEKITSGHIVGPLADPDFQLYPFYLVNAASFKGSANVDTDPKGIKAGYTPVISCGTTNVACKFVKILSYTKKKTGTVNDPTTPVPKDSTFVALIYPCKQVLFETAEAYPSLGKFVCRDSASIVAAGKIIKCISNEEALKEYGVSIEMMNADKKSTTDTQGKKAKK